MKFPWIHYIGFQEGVSLALRKYPDGMKAFSVLQVFCESNPVVTDGFS